MSAKDCVFCKIADGRIASELIHKDEICVAFKDLNPQAPVHVLIVPREHVDSLAKTESQHIATLGHLLATSAGIARIKGFADDGYRVVINTNSDGGQTVPHLHVHLLAGRQFVFPPG